jgi:hypothetical protein
MLSLELEFGKDSEGQDAMRQCKKEYRKGPPKRPKVGYDQGRLHQRLQNRRFYRLPDGRAFLLIGRWDTDVNRWGKVQAGPMTPDEAFVGGSVVDGPYRLRAGDSVLFLRTGWGRKGGSAKFGTILAHPAWPYRSPRAIVGNGGRGNPDGHAKHIIQVDAVGHYPLMTLGEIKALPVKEVAADDAHLYLWTTNAFIEEAHDLARAWGFEPNYRAWKCPSCGAGVEAVEIKEHSTVTYRLTLTGESSYRWEQVEVEPDDDPEEQPFRCGHCGEVIEDENGKVIRNAATFNAYLDAAVIQMQALEFLERLAAASPEGSTGIA